MKATLNTLLLLLLTTTSAIAEVNFTEQTVFYYSDFNETKESVVTPLYLTTDGNGITLSSSKNILAKGARPTSSDSGRLWRDESCSTGNNSYTTNFFQVSSSHYAIKKLSLYLSSSKIQVIIVGWKGTVSGTADYYKTFTHDKITTASYRWVEHDLSEWEGVKTLRLYANFGNSSDLTVDDTKVTVSSISSGSYYVYGVQVSLDGSTVPTSISSYGVAAFSSASALDFTNVTECSAFYADSYDNGVLHLTKATGVVPAHFGLLLSSTNEGAVSFSIPIATAEHAALTIDDNKFVATDESTYTPTTSTEALALGVKGGTVGFYYVGEGVTVPQYRFYLPAPSVGEAKNLTLDFGSATAITVPSITEGTASGDAALRGEQQATSTDLLGRPCPTPRPGTIYIKGGKAYIAPR